MSIHDAREDLRDLLNRDYKKKTALDFVCNHYNLNKEDRNILARTTFSDEVSEMIKGKEVTPLSIQNHELVIDTFNVLITLEKVLYGHPLVCDDGVIRDDAGVFGKYKITEKLSGLLEKLNYFFKVSGPSKVIFYIDKQVSHSGELASIIRNHDWNIGVEVKLSSNTDHDIKNHGGIVATADFGILKYIDYFVDIPKYFLFAW